MNCIFAGNLAAISMSEIAKPNKRKLSLGWLELSLGAAAVVLVFLLFPQLWRETLWAVDLRGWSKRSYTLATAAIVLTLTAMRLAPQFLEQHRHRSEQRAKLLVEEARIKALREEKEMLERMKEGMRRRMY